MSKKEIIIAVLCLSVCLYPKTKGETKSVRVPGVYQYLKTIEQSNVLTRPRIWDTLESGGGWHYTAKDAGDFFYLTAFTHHYLVSYPMPYKHGKDLPRSELLARLAQAQEIYYGDFNKELLEQMIIDYDIDYMITDNGLIWYKLNNNLLKQYKVIYEDARNVLWEIE